MNDIIPFNYGDSLIRVVNDETTNEPLWIAKDVCDILGYVHITNTLSKLDEDEKLTVKILQSGQNRDMMCITESGLYTLILRSNKPEAKPFKRWVTHEVLPTIRKTGTYSLNQNAGIDLSPLYAIMEMQTQLLQSISNQNTAVVQMLQSVNIQNSLMIEMMDKVQNTNEMNHMGIRIILNTIEPKCIVMPLARNRIGSEQRKFLYDLIYEKGMSLSHEYSIKSEVMVIAMFGMIKREFSVRHYSDITINRFDEAVTRVTNYDPTV